MLMKKSTQSHLNAVRKLTPNIPGSKHATVAALYHLLKSWATAFINLDLFCQYQFL